MTRLRANTLTLLGSNAGTAGLAFLLSALIGRVLGESGLGVYAAALAWTFPLAIIADFGLATLITRDVAADFSRGSAYLRAATEARLVLGGGMAVLFFVFAPLLSDNQSVVEGIRLSAPLVIIFPLFGSFTALFRAHRVMWPIALLNVGMLSAQVILTALVFAFGGDVLDVLAVNVVTSAGQLVVAWGMYRGRFGPFPRQAQRIVPLHLLRNAWPFAVAAVLAALHTRLNVILLESLADTSAVGVFAASGRFIEGANMVTRAAFDALFPALGAVVAQPNALAALFGRARRMLVLLGFVFAGGGVVAGPLLVTLVYGPGFDDAGIVLQVAAVALLPATLKGGYLLYCYTVGRAQLANTVIAGTLILRFAASAVLIPAGNAIGAALVDVIVETVAFVLLALYIMNRLYESKEVT